MGSFRGRLGSGGRAAFEVVIDRVYDASLDADRWPDALAAMSGALGADAAQLIVADRAFTRVVHTVVHGYPDDASVEYARYFHRLDYRARRLLEMPIGAVMQDHLEFDDAFVRRSEYYQDFLRRYDARYVTASRAAYGDTDIMYALLSGDRRGPLGVAQTRLLQRLQPHLARAGAIHHRLAAVQRERDDLRQALDRLGDAFLFVDADRRLRSANAAGRSLLASGSHLRLRNGRLYATDAQADATLSDFLAAAAIGDRAPDGVRQRPLVVGPRRSVDLRGVVLALGPEGGARVAGGARFLVWIHQPGGAAPRLDALRAWYRLSPAEARLAVFLARGGTVAEASDAFGVAVSTLRTQLESLFGKTGTRRQSELVALVARTQPPSTEPNG